jgi:hypothetical protein
MRTGTDSQRLADLKAYFEDEKIEELLRYRDMHRFVAEENDVLVEVINQKLSAEEGVPSTPVVKAPVVATPVAPQPSTTTANLPQTGAAQQREEHEAPANGTGVGEFAAKEFNADITFESVHGPRVKFSLPGRSA